MTRLKRKCPTRTPVRRALKTASRLQASVRDGLAALKDADRGFLDEDVRADFADSLDLDAATRAGHEQENRWDYLLGHASTGRVVGLEPHSAKEDEVSTVIAKKKASLAHLGPHLNAGANIAEWFWVASGKVRFADTEKERRRLDQHGIRFVGTRMLRKHLVPPSGTKAKA